MKEIKMPVLVLDDDCMKCEDLDIGSQTKRQIWAEDQCISQEVVVMCSNLKKCERLMKRMERNKDAGDR